MQSGSHLAIVTVFYRALCLLVSCHGYRCMLPLTFDSHNKHKVFFVLAISSVRLIPRPPSIFLLLVVEMKQGWGHLNEAKLLLNGSAKPYSGYLGTYLYFASGSITMVTSFVVLKIETDGVALGAHYCWCGQGQWLLTVSIPCQHEPMYFGYVALLAITVSRV